MGQSSGRGADRLSADGRVPRAAHGAGHRLHPRFLPAHSSRIAGHLDAHRRPATRFGPLWLRRKLPPAAARPLLSRRTDSRSSSVPSNPAFPPVFSRGGESLRAVQVASGRDHSLCAGRIRGSRAVAPAPRLASEPGHESTRPRAARLSTGVGRTDPTRGGMGPGARRECPGGREAVPSESQHDGLAVGSASQASAHAHRSSGNQPQPVPYRASVPTARG